MKAKVLLLIIGILIGLGLFESLGGYLGIANDASTNMSPWLGIVNGAIFYLASIILFGIRYVYLKKHK